MVYNPGISGGTHRWNAHGWRLGTEAVFQMPPLIKAKYMPKMTNQYESGKFDHRGGEKFSHRPLRAIFTTPLTGQNWLKTAGDDK